MHSQERGLLFFKFLFKLEAKLQNSKLLLQALQHSSLSSNNNERLEFLGDRVLSLVWSTFLYRKHPNCTEGKLSNMLAYLVQTNTLLKICKYYNLEVYLLLGKGTKATHNIITDAFEAVLGAIYLETDLQTVTKIIFALYSKIVDFTSLNPHEISLQNSKQVVQEYLQQHFNGELPRYSLVRKEGAFFILKLELKALKEVYFTKCANIKQGELVLAQKTSIWKKIINAI